MQTLLLQNYYFLNVFLTIKSPLNEVVEINLSLFCFLSDFPQGQIQVPEVCIVPRRRVSLVLSVGKRRRMELAQAQRKSLCPGLKDPQATAHTGCCCKGGLCPFAPTTLF